MKHGDELLEEIHILASRLEQLTRKEARQPGLFTYWDFVRQGTQDIANWLDERKRQPG